MTKITPRIRRALEIFRDHGPLPPRTFGRYMWPDSEGWNRFGLDGLSLGGNMVRASKSYIGKLYKRGFVTTRGRWHSEYQLTPEGHKALTDTET